MDWTPENRLKIIKAIAQKTHSFNPNDVIHDLRRIVVLCEYPDEFLELNIENYKDVIDNEKNT